MQNNSYEKTFSPIVSVVISMYNCEEFLPELLSMFSNQTFTDFEVICVIDGSSDRTEEIVKNYCDTDQRFLYVVRENIGPGAARNTGLDMARGKYVIFSDADNEYYTEYLKKLYETAVKNEAQIVMCRFVEKDHKLNSVTVKGFDEKQFQENVPYSHCDIEDIFVSVNGRITNKLYNTEFLRKNKLRFPEIRVSEDDFFSSAGLSVADRIFVIYDILSNCNLHSNLNSIRSSYIHSQYEAVDSIRLLYKWIKDHSLLEIHGEDYLKWINKMLLFYGGMKVTPKLISEFAHLLNAEEPFKSMTSGEIRKYIGAGLFAVGTRRKLKELSNFVSPDLIESDKELSDLLNYCKNVVHTSDLLIQISKERYVRDFYKPEAIPFLTEEKKADYYINLHVPEKVCLEASTICQLRCAGCGFQRGDGDDLGRGYLTIENFKKFCEMNPFVREIELANYGEIFMNPDLVKIMYHAKEIGVSLSAWHGSNFNTVSDEQMQAMVDTEFLGIRLSIDGASPETYSKYRIGGNFDKVIENVKKLIELKKKAGARYPILKWGYIFTEHNELDIGKAKEMARSLGIPIYFKRNWDKTYTPVNREYMKKETGFEELTESEYSAVHKVNPFNDLCNYIFRKPQINWDGRLLGCCTRRYATFDVNVFEVGLVRAIRSAKYIEAKECLLTVHPDRERYSSCTCYDCETRKKREQAGLAFEL